MFLNKKSCRTSTATNLIMIVNMQQSLTCMHHDTNHKDHCYKNSVNERESNKFNLRSYATSYIMTTTTRTFPRLVRRERTRRREYSATLGLEAERRSLPRRRRISSSKRREIARKEVWRFLSWLSSFFSTEF